MSSFNTVGGGGSVNPVVVGSLDSVNKSTLSKLSDAFGSLTPVKMYRAYVGEKTLPEKLILDCMDFGKTVGADEAGANFAKFLGELPLAKVESSASKACHCYVDRANDAVNTKLEEVRDVFKNPISINLGMKEYLMEKGTSGKVLLTAGKIAALPFNVIVKAVKVSIESVVLGVGILVKSPVVISKAVLDTYDVLRNTTGTEKIRRTIAFIAGAIFCTAYIATHPVALVAGIAAAKASAGYAMLFGIVMAVVEGYFHGEVAGEAIAAAFEVDRKTSNTALVAACVISGVACVACKACIENVSAAEIFIAGGVGKAVVITGTVLAALITSPLYHFGEGMVKENQGGIGSSDAKEYVKNMFYKDDIKETAKICGGWLKEKLNSFGEPFKEIAEIWKPKIEAPLS